MKIALVIPHFDPALGGAEHWTWQFARRIADWGHKVHVVAESFARDAESIGVVAHPLPKSRGRLAFAAAAEDAVRRLRADVVHDMGSGQACDLFMPHGGSRTASFEQNLLMLPAWRRPLKRAVSRLLPRYREFDKLLTRQYAADGRCFLALSQMVAGDMRRFHAVPPESLRIVYNGVDVERFSPELRARYRDRTRGRLGLRNEFLLLIVAHNFELKGVPSLLKAVARLAREQRDVHLAIAGGKRLDRWRSFADRLGAGQAVSLLGPQADVRPFYAAADLYVQPTWYDPCSLVLLEALACGLPVVTSRFNGAGELLTPGREGEILDDPGDDAALAQAIARWMDHADLPAAGRAARRLAEQHTLERNCRELLTVYEGLRPARRAA